MIYVRGQAEDYDHWAALGNSAWSYREVLPHFQRSEVSPRLRAYRSPRLLSSCRYLPHGHAVVDEQLRVQGLDGIRVVDGATMPTLVSGNTNAAITMISEKGAAMVLASANT